VTDFPAQAVLARLGWGRDNAASIGSLAESLQWPRRAIEQAVQDLRLQGKPIASGPAGVWLTADPDELDATYRSLRNRIKSQSVTAWALRSTSKRMRDGSVQATLPWTEARDAA
jgi:biotin operon repressor